MLSFATGGNSDNPTPVQITRAFRKLFFSSFLNTSSGNCAEDFDELLGQCAEKPNVPIVVATPSQPQMPQTLDIGPTDYRELNVSFNLMRASAIAYDSGYLLQKCFKQHCCQTCTTALVSNELDDERKLFLFQGMRIRQGNFWSTACTNHTLPRICHTTGGSFHLKFLGIHQTFLRW